MSFFRFHPPGIRVFAKAWRNFWREYGFVPEVVFDKTVDDCDLDDICVVEVRAIYFASTNDPEGVSLGDL